MKYNQHIAELGPGLYRLGIRQVVICPGSRNAPLTQLFTSDKYFRCHSIVDERSAGYVALGMARELDEPVVVVCTSGTAVLNLAPALAEAFHQKVALVVLTADRPLETISQFDNQWLDQEAPFYTYTKGFVQLPEKVSLAEDLEQMMIRVESLVGSALALPCGPVHINVPLLEPLYEPLPEPILGSGSLVDPPAADEEGSGELCIKADQKLLILAGMGAPEVEIRKKLEQVLLCRKAMVLAENIANMPAKGFCANPDLILAGVTPGEREGLLPDRVISFGGQVVSKRLRLFLQSVPNLDHTELEGDIGHFLDHIIAQHPTEKGFKNTYQLAWKKAESRVLIQARKRMDALPFGNLSVVDRILTALPGKLVLHLGNSGSIRYSQLVPKPLEQRCYANRGTSGIDGCVSTAVGAAMVSKEMHVLLLGDLSFVYDSNAMWNRNFPENLRIIVINDGGGGIFRLLDGPARMEFFEEFSVTHHPVSLDLLGQSFGREVRRASDFQELKKALSELYLPGSKGFILEVDTTGSENSLIFEDFLKFKQ